MELRLNDLAPNGANETAPTAVTQMITTTVESVTNSTQYSSPQLSFAQMPGKRPDLVCFSHLRWDFVFQRPQHLMTRFAKDIRVFFIEEAIWDKQESSPYLKIRQSEQGVTVVTPHIPEHLAGEFYNHLLSGLVNSLLTGHGIENFIAWYYTPIALGFTRELTPTVTVYDCMDELSAFKNAPLELIEREAELLQRADLVFTGGQSLYEAKRDRHQRVFAFPSSIEREHFAKGRKPLPEPEDQQNIPHPRLGFYGVLDERLDIPLLSAIADMRPDWHFILLGPVVKIDPASLPQNSNIHYLGMKSYEQLPQYLSGWDVALLLFAMNESTRYISPTKTPEYLAAGKPVVSTPIRDVVRPYGEKGLVQIAGDAESFVEAAQKALTQGDDQQWMTEVDHFLMQNSWDITQNRMAHLICEQIIEKNS